MADRHTPCTICTSKSNCSSKPLLISSTSIVGGIDGGDVTATATAATDNDAADDDDDCDAAVPVDNL